jgi:hypothetical protein
MKLIDYDKYSKKWTPRSVVMLLLVEALVTGFFLGTGLVEAVHSDNSWGWIWPLVLGFGSGIGALQATLLALHNCPASAESQRTQATPGV